MKLRAVVSVWISIAACASEANQGAVDQDQPDPTRPPPDQFIQVGDVSLHYLDWGGSGDLLLFIPGVTGTAHIFNGIAGEFTDAYRVIAMTRRGHGASDKPESTIDLDVLADDIAGVIDRFTDGPAILVGHSYGGVEMPRVARRHPSKVRALIFLDAVYDWSGLLQIPGQPGYAIADSAYASFEDLEAWFRSALPEFWSSVARAHLRSQVRVTEAGSVIWQLPYPGPRFFAFANLYAEWSGSEFSAIKVPVLSIQADQEKFLMAHLAARGFPPEDVEAVGRWADEYENESKASARAMLLDAVPDAVTIVLDSTHHNLQLQRPDVVVRLMKEFLVDHVAGPTGGR